MLLAGATAVLTMGMAAMAAAASEQALSTKSDFGVAKEPVHLTWTMFGDTVTTDRRPTKAGFCS
jgi:hypothetical protein